MLVEQADTMTKDEQSTLGRIEGTLAVLMTNMETLNRKVMGTAGLSDRLPRIEEKVSSLDERLDGMEKKMDTILAGNSTYIKDDAGLAQKIFLRKESVLYIVMVFLVIHTLIPIDFNVTNLWEVVKKLMGL